MMSGGGCCGFKYCASVFGQVVQTGHSAYVFGQVVQTGHSACLYVVAGSCAWCGWDVRKKRTRVMSVPGGVGSRAVRM